MGQAPTPLRDHRSTLTQLSNCPPDPHEVVRRIVQELFAYASIVLDSRADRAEELEDYRRARRLRCVAAVLRQEVGL